MWRKIIPITLSRAGYFPVRFRTVVSNSNGVGIGLKNQLLSKLASKFGNERIIKEAFKKSPELEQSDIYLWSCFISAMHDFDFKFEEIVEMISLSPDVLSITEEKIKRVMGRWEFCSKMRKDELKVLIISIPDFLHLEPAEIQKRISFLRAYATSSEYLLSLLLLCPNVMFEKWSEVKKKINFLNYEMLVSRPEVLQCKALSKSFDHIKMRFLITERCGFYIRPHAAENKQTRAEILKLNNPKLKQITDSSDKSFAKRVAKITFEEYDVFSEIYASEQDQLSDSDDSDDECD